MDLIAYNPMQKFNYLFNSDSIFSDLYQFSGSMNETVEPRVNIIDKGSAFVVEAFVAGYDKDEINLEVENNTLTLSGNKNEDNKAGGDGYRKREFFYSSFKRSFNLGKEIESENISAEFNNGVLAVNLPKKEQAQSKKISISVK
tara:strand:+ start:6748 stop:7179 length:432 start_codon:yes stop_codon:yes gene_type:complete